MVQGYVCIFAVLSIEHIALELKASWNTTTGISITETLAEAQRYISDFQSSMSMLD